eukprot:scaffold1094_cov185-Alexandrium_tamarense.AAC.5
MSLCIEVRYLRQLIGLQEESLDLSVKTFIHLWVVYQLLSLDTKPDCLLRNLHVAVVRRWNES